MDNSTSLEGESQWALLALMILGEKGPKLIWILNYSLIHVTSFTYSGIYIGIYNH